MEVDLLTSDDLDIASYLCHHGLASPHPPQGSPLGAPEGTARAVGGEGLMGEDGGVAEKVGGPVQGSAFDADLGFDQSPPGAAGGHSPPPSNSPPLRVIEFRGFCF